MTDSYAIQAGTIPGFAEASGGIFISVTGLPDRTVRNMVTVMGKPRACTRKTRWRSRCAYGTSLP